MSGNKSARGDRPVNREEYDGIKYHRLAPGISTHPLIRSGRPCIEGTTIEVRTIVALQKDSKMNARQIANHLQIEPRMVRNALTYYGDHKQYIDVCIELSSIHHRQLAESHYGDKTREILSRRESVT